MRFTCAVLAASYAASAGAESASSAARTDGNDFEDVVEAADGEDLRDDRLQRRDGDAGAVRAHLLRRDHQHAQPDAADVFDAGEIQDQAASCRRRTAQ